MRAWRKLADPHLAEYLELMRGPARKNHLATWEFYVGQNAAKTTAGEIALQRLKDLDDKIDAIEQEIDKRREVALAASCKAMDDEQLEELYFQADESLGEITSQHRSEVAAYGDSWPGAQIQIAQQSRHVAIIKAEYDRRNQEAA